MYGFTTLSKFRTLRCPKQLWRYAFDFNNIPQYYIVAMVYNVIWSLYTYKIFVMCDDSIPTAPVHKYQGQ